MNNSLAVFLINTRTRGILVEYNPDDTKAPTLAKTLDPSIKVDDYVIVETDTRHGMTVCKVKDVDVEPDFDSREQVKWIIGVVNWADFAALRDQEKQAIAKINSAEKRKKRDELRKALEVDASEDLKALPIYDDNRKAERPAG